MNKAIASLVSTVSVVGVSGSFAVNASSTESENKADVAKDNNSSTKNEPSKLEKIGELAGRVGGVFFVGVPLVGVALFAGGGIGAIVGGNATVAVLTGLTFSALVLYVPAKVGGILGKYIGGILSDIFSR